MRLRPVRAPGRTLAARKLPRRFTSTGLAHSDPRGGGHTVRAGQLPPAARRAGAVPLRASARAGAAAAAPPAAAFPAWAAVVCPLTPSWHGTPSPPPPPPHAPLRPPQFTTPIYHPNIDSAGRICLDILNMPPKGAWKPSLNLPTVLSSIQLLMSHPNPDDGLMVEIVRPPSHAVSRTLCGHCASATGRPQLAAARLAHLLTPPPFTDARVHPPPREVQADGRGAHPPPCAPRLRRLRLRRLRPRLLRRRQLLRRRLSPGGWRPRCRGEQCQGAAAALPPSSSVDGGYVMFFHILLDSVHNGGRRPHVHGWIRAAAVGDGAQAVGDGALQARLVPEGDAALQEGDARPGGARVEEAPTAAPTAGPTAGRGELQDGRRRRVWRLLLLRYAWRTWHLGGRRAPHTPRQVPVQWESDKQLVERNQLRVALHLNCAACALKIKPQRDYSHNQTPKMHYDVCSTAPRHEPRGRHMAVIRCPHPRRPLPSAAAAAATALCCRRCCLRRCCLRRCCLRRCRPPQPSPIPSSTQVHHDAIFHCQRVLDADKHNVKVRRHAERAARGRGALGVAAAARWHSPWPTRWQTR